MNKRHKEISRYQLLRHEKDAMFQSLASALAALFKVPISMISVMTEREQVVKGAAGITARVLPRQQTLCNQVVLDSAPLLVDDTLEDARFKQNPYVTGEPYVRSYAGVPLKLNDFTVGALCLIDTQSRQWTEQDVSLLQSLAAHVIHCFEMADTSYRSEQEHSLLNDSPAVLVRFDVHHGLELSFISENARGLLGINIDELRNKDTRFEHLIHSDDLHEFVFVINNHKAGVTSCDCKFRLTTEKGTTWLQMISKGIYDEQHELQAIQMLLLDNSQQQYLEERLLETNERMRLLLEASDLGTWDWDIRKDVNKINQRWCQMLGLNVDDVDANSAFWRNKVHPADLLNVETELNRHIKGETPVYNTQYRMRHQRGHWVWIETFGRAVGFDEQQKPYRLAGTHRDITAQKHAELKENQQRQILTFINKVQRTFLACQNIKEACSEIFSELLELAKSEFGFIAQMREHNNQDALLIHAISDISWSEETEKFMEAFDRGELYFYSLNNLFGSVITGAKPVIANSPAKHEAARGTPKGHPPLLRFLGLPIIYNDKVRGMIGLANKLTDYTEEDVNFFQPLLDTLGSLYFALELDEARKNAERQLKLQAQTDPLTKLFNRRAFTEKLEQLYKAEMNPLCLAIVDIDLFKKINDTYGHQAGDIALIQVATIIRDTLRTDDTVARLGGEEFGLQLNLQNQDDATALLEKLRQKIATTPCIFEGQSINVSVSIGAVMAGIDQKSYEKDLNSADRALYSAKKQGRNQLCWFAD